MYFELSILLSEKSLLTTITIEIPEIANLLESEWQQLDP